MAEDTRIRPPAAHREFLDELTDSKEGIFSTKAAALLFAAAIGFQNKQRKPLGQTGEGIRWHIFDNAQDAGFIYALALAETGSLSALDPTDREADNAVTIFEEYAAGGLDYLETHFRPQPGDSLENLIGILQAAQQAEEGSGVGMVEQSTLELLGDF